MLVGIEKKSTVADENELMFDDNGNPINLNSKHVQRHLKNKEHGSSRPGHVRYPRSHAQRVENMKRTNHPMAKEGLERVMGEKEDRKMRKRRRMAAKDEEEKNRRRV
jgi:hypothetical protein